MWSLPAQMIEEFSKEFAISGLCLDIDIDADTQIKITTLDVPVFLNGNKYIPHSFEIDEAKQDNKLTPDSITVRIDDVSNLISGLALNQDIRGKSVSLYVVVLDKNAQVVANVSIFNGFIDSIELKGKTAHLRIIHETVFLKRTTQRKHQNLCPWRFKDPYTCKYSGSASNCDKTYEACKTLGNEVHFGGFKSLPDIEEQQIYWGRIPK